MNPHAQLLPWLEDVDRHDAVAVAERLDLRGPLQLRIPLEVRRDHPHFAAMTIDQPVQLGTSDAGHVHCAGEKEIPLECHAIFA